jgi:hypothetical protein
MTFFFTLWVASHNLFDLFLMSGHVCGVLGCVPHSQPQKLDVAGQVVT